MGGGDEGRGLLSVGVAGALGLPDSCVMEQRARLVFLAVVLWGGRCIWSA